MKSWKTTFFGVVVFGCAIWSAADNIRREAWPAHYWFPTVALVATGCIGWHAKDHTHKEK